MQQPDSDGPSLPPLAPAERTTPVDRSHRDRQRERNRRSHRRGSRPERDAEKPSREKTPAPDGDEKGGKIDIRA